MAKFKYHKISNSKKIRYILKVYRDSQFIVFLHGFMSDLEGKKPSTFYNFAKKNKLGFLALEYSGHGKSSGEFIKGNISKWTKDAKILIKKIVKRSSCFNIKTISIQKAIFRNDVFCSSKQTKHI